MRPRKQDRVRAELAGLQRRIERWRRAGERGRRMPAPLWQQAVEFGRIHGVHAVAHCLRLDYYSLKRRLGAEPAIAPLPSAPEFVEVALGRVLPVACSTVEILRPDGVRLAISAVGHEDLVAVTSTFLTAGR